MDTDDTARVSRDRLLHEETSKDDAPVEAEVHCYITLDVDLPISMGRIVVTLLKWLAMIVEQAWKY